MAEVRHISYRAEDVDAMAKFFVDAMVMTRSLAVAEPGSGKP
jgi:hypothetical protein